VTEGCLAAALIVKTLRPGVLVNKMHDWYSSYLAARMGEKLGAEEREVLCLYVTAHNQQPARAEPLHALARYCRIRKLWPLAYLFSRQAANIRVPTDVQDCIFLEADVYVWRARDEWSVAASWTGRLAEAREIYESLLANPALPASDQKRVRANLELAVKSLE
jgi:hypothetical protein